MNVVFTKSLILLSGRNMGEVLGQSNANEVIMDNLHNGILICRHVEDRAWWHLIGA